MPDATAPQQPRTETAGTWRAPELCVVVPILNEEGNVSALVDLVETAMPEDVAWEIIFVDDDSTDRSREFVTEMARRQPNVRLVHRSGRTGLASAFIEGANASVAPVIAAIDGDLQHDERLLPTMLDVIREGANDIVIGSRYVAGGGTGTWDQTRARMSTTATRMTQMLTPTPMTDPMSGFFMITRPAFEKALPRLSAVGFKILLDIVTALPEPPRITELPYIFRSRVEGKSKMNAGVLFDFGLLLLDKTIGRYLPARFVAFAAIGVVGLGLHLAILKVALTTGLDFKTAQTIATLTAIVGNFELNNQITFRDHKLTGVRAAKGIVVFAIACGIGGIANLNVAQLMVDDKHAHWWTAGLAGAAMSLVWNYAVGSTLTWRRQAR